MQYVAPFKRLALERELLTSMEQAQREYREACMADIGKINLGPRAQGGMAAAIEEKTRLAETRERYRKALEAFTAFVVYGKMPV